jgi:hypothetical protein
MSDNPSNFVYHPVTQTLSWDGVPDSEEYLITSSDNSSGQPNQVIYEGGIATSCSFVKTSGTYYLDTKTRPRKGPWGVWGPLEPVVVP